MFKLLMLGCLGLLSSEFVQITFSEVTASEVVKSIVQVIIGVITIYSILKKLNNKNQKNGTQ